jgi:hypothetical protein
MIKSKYNNNKTIMTEPGCLRNSTFLSLNVNNDTWKILDYLFLLSSFGARGPSSPPVDMHRSDTKDVQVDL